MWPFIEGRLRRPRAMWRLLIHFSVFAILVGVATSLIATAWFILGPSEVGSGEAAPADSPSLFLISTLASAVAVTVSLWLAGRFLDKRPFRAYGLDVNASWWLDLAFGLFLGAFLMCGVFLVQFALGWVEVTNAFEANLGDAPFALAILLPISVFLCVGFYEEALSRGYQLTNLAEGLNFPALGGPKGAVVLAWIVTSGVFGILHLGNPNASFISTTNIALAGILLGVGYVLTGQLAIPIGVHITWNFFQGNVFGFPVSGLDGLGATFLATEVSGPELWTGGVFGPEAGLLVPVAIAVGSAMTVLWVKFRHGRVGVLASIAEPPEPDEEKPTAA